MRDPVRNSAAQDTALSRRHVIQALAVAAGAAVVPLPALATSAADGSPLVPFKIAVPQADLDDLKLRLDLTRWPVREIVADQSQGAQLGEVNELVAYWRTRYDWRRLEARLNGYPQFKTEIDGLGIHFVHVRSPHANALPLIMTHGWPGSIVEFLDTIDPLVHPTAHGGKPEDAFHVVLPSIPGYGFSDKPRAPGWNRTRIARAWDVLMKRLGYEQYVAQGGDWGSVITTEMGRLRPQGLTAIHVNLPFVVPNPLPATPTAEEAATLAQIERFADDGSGYFSIQSTHPETLGFALADSPVGQAAWIYEKFAAWSDSQGKPEDVLGYDRILDDIMFYWVTNSGTSSAWMYGEHRNLSFHAVPLDLPVAVTVFPGEIFTPPKAWAEQAYSRLIYWNRASRGGHFAAFEQPAIFTAELQAAFSSIRSS